MWRKEEKKEFWVKVNVYKLFPLFNFENQNCIFLVLSTGGKQTFFRPLIIIEQLKEKTLFKSLILETMRLYNGQELKQKKRKIS